MDGSSSEEPGSGEPREVAVPRLVELHGARLYALGLRFCGSPEEAQDLVQETFLLAYKSWDRFEGRSRASTWLYTIAARVCQRFHRKRSGEPDALESLDELLPFGEATLGVRPDPDDPHELAARHDARGRVEEAIAELPIDFRMPIVLKEIVGFSLAEIASILGIPEATVKTRVHRARLRVRRALEEALPRRAVPPPRFSEQVCLDLLRAKQESLDRGVPFEFPDDMVCERCSELFATLDLGREICHDLARGRLPEELERALRDSLRAAT